MISNRFALIARRALIQQRSSFSTTLVSRDAASLEDTIKKLLEEKDREDKNAKNKVDQPVSTKPSGPLTFAKMFKESKFVSIGDLEQKLIYGKIVEVVGDDLYIDYGGKFNCICKRPNYNQKLYVRNANVIIKLKSFEMSSYFLNTARNITLLESDADLIGLVPRENSNDLSERDRLRLDEIKQLNEEPYY